MTRRKIPLKVPGILWTLFLYLKKPCNRKPPRVQSQKQKVGRGKHCWLHLQTFHVVDTTNTSGYQCKFTSTDLVVTRMTCFCSFNFTSFLADTKTNFQNFATLQFYRKLPQRLTDKTSQSALTLKSDRMLKICEFCSGELFEQPFY